MTMTMPPVVLTGPQKAAIVVRLLAGGEMPISLSDLPEDMQADLIEQIGSLGPLDPSLLDLVMEEFAQLLERGSSDGRLDIASALDLLDGAISPRVARRLRSESPVIPEPWAAVARQPADRLTPLVQKECAEVGAVILSKLPVETAAGILNLLPGEQARRLTLAISRVTNVRPEAVRRIGEALARVLLDEGEAGAFEGAPAERIGAILNLSRASTRDSVMSALAEEDAALADGVKRAIFTFADIPQRVAPSDVPKVLRRIEQSDLVRALAHGAATSPAVVEFLLAGVPQRMAANLREEMSEAGAVDAESGETATTALTAAIRELEAAGEIFLIYDKG